MVYFKHCLTMGDIMGTMYGEVARVMVGALNFIIAICSAGAEIVMLGIVTQSFLGVDARLGIIIGGLLLTFYVVYGGMNAVTATDVTQFLVLLVLLPVLAATALQQAGGIREVYLSIAPERFQLWSHPRFPYYFLHLFLVISIFQTNMVDPALIQRMLMARSKRQLRHMFLTLTGLFTVVFLVFAVLGTVGHQLYPTLAAEAIIPHMIRDLLPVGLRGLMTAGIIAVVMASADSYLHAAGFTLVHDVLEPLSVYRGNQLNKMRWVRYTTLLAGLLIIGVGLLNWGDDLYSLIAVGAGFASPIIALPFFMGLLGLKPHRNAFYVSAAATLITYFGGRIFIIDAYAYLRRPICMLVSGVTFLGTHFLRNRGFLTVQRGPEASDEHFLQPDTQQFDERFWRWVPTPRSILRYSQDQVAKYGAPYLLFGAFYCINFTLPYFMWTHESSVSYDLMLYLRVLGGLLCGLLVMRDQWPHRFLAYFPTFWHITLLYCLPFVSTVMFLLTSGSVEWLINVAITIMFLIVLVDWLSFILLTSLGVGLGSVFYLLVVGPIELRLDFSTEYLLVYQVIFATLIGLLFARRKQLGFDKLATDNQALLAKELVSKGRLLEAFREKVRILQTLKHAGIQNLLQVAKLLKDLREQEPSSLLSAATPHIESTLIPMALQLQALEHRATDYLRLDVTATTVQELVKEVQAQLISQGMTEDVQYQVRARHEVLECDVARLASLLVRSIVTFTPKASKRHKKSIYVILEDTELQYALPSVHENYVKKVAALRFTITNTSSVPPVQAFYVAQMKVVGLPTLDNTQELELLENKRVVRAHYGASNVTPTHHSYVVPLRLREVRPADMDRPYMELGVAPKRADDRYPGAQAQEQEFLAAVAQRTNAHMSTVQTVLELIKWYHGPMQRNTGEPFYLHPLAVAKIVLDYNQDEATILAALLHDTIEDTALLLEHVDTIFGKDTAAIVDKVTHLESTQENFYKIKLSAEENVLMLLGSGDDRAMYVKLADRLHNMRTIEGKSPASRTRIAKETIQFFVPQALRLGLTDTAQELKERCIKVLGEVA